MSTINVNGYTLDQARTTAALDQVADDLAAVNKGGNAKAEDYLPPVKEFLFDMKKAVVLPPPPSPAADYAELNGMLPSLGSQVMALVGDAANEQRQVNKEERILQTKRTVAQLKEQATEMRNQAVTQLVLGVISGAVQFTMGAFTAGATGKVLHMSGNSTLSSTSQHTAVADNAETLLTSRTSFIKGVSEAVGSASQFADTGAGYSKTTFDARMKDIDAQVEQLRAMQASIDSLDEALKQTIQKAMQAQEAIQQSTNQTRTRILG